MTDRNASCSNPRDPVCIDCNRVLDSCRDKDCFENTRVYLTDCGQDLIEKTNNIRVKDAKIEWAQIAVNDVPFNGGFYQVTIRYYTKLYCEACACIGKPQEFEGIAVCEKKVILYGSEGNVSVFKSDPNESGFCAVPPYGEEKGSNLPIAVCEVASPVVLDLKVVEYTHPCCCCCCMEEIPDRISDHVNGSLVDYEEGKHLVATLGFFSVVRIERPGQYLVNAVENSIPEKECVMTTDDPCAVFRRMDFPVGEFAPPPFPQRGCGCGK